MPSNVIQFIIKAIDNTKSAFASAGRGIKKFADGSMAVLKKLGSYAKWAFLGVAAGVTLAVREYLNYAKAVAKLDVTLSRENRQNEITKQSLLDLADELQKTAGVEDEAVINAEAILLTYKKLSGDVIPRVVKAIVDMNVAMTDGDVSLGGLQASAVQLGRALSDPKKGILLLARAGVILDKEQKKAIKSAVAHKDVSKAQALILDALEEKYGGMAKAISKSQAGVDRVKGSFGDLVKEIGRVVLVGFGLEKGAKNIAEWMDKLTESGKISKWGASLVGWLGDALKLVEKIGTHFQEMFTDEMGKLDIGGGFLQMGKELGLGILKILWSGAKKLGTMIGEGISELFRKIFKIETRTPEEQEKEKAKIRAENDYQAFIRRIDEEKTGRIRNPEAMVKPGDRRSRENYEKYLNEAIKPEGQRDTSFDGYVNIVKAKADEQRKIEEAREFEKLTGENRRKKAVIDSRQDSTINGAIRALDEGKKALMRDAAIKLLKSEHGFDLESSKKDLEDYEKRRDANTPILEEIRDNLTAK